MTGILVQDQRKKWKRQPEYWMICKETFTKEELQPYEAAMARVKVSFLPHSIPCKWGAFMTKQEIFDWLAWIQKKAIRKPRKGNRK